MKLAKTFTAILIGVAAYGLLGGLAQEGGLRAADGHQARPTQPAVASPPSAPSVVQSPSVFLFRGGPQRTGSISGSHLPRHPVVLWKMLCINPLGELLLADGVIYVGDTQGNLYAIKLVDGSVLWTFAGRTQIFAAPAKRGGTIYFASQNGLTALSQEEGRVLWNCTSVGNATESSPLIVKDRIIVAGYNGKISAVDFNGKLIWQHDIAEDEIASPPGFDAGRARISGTAARPRTAASDDTAIFLPIFDQSRIAVIDLKAGRRRWSFQAKGWIYGEPTVTDDKVFFGSQDDHLYCLDKRRKTLLWSFAGKSRIEAGVAYQDGSVYFGSCDGRFYRINAETGKEVWSYQTPRSPGASTAIYSAPLCTEDAIYFGSFDGHLYCLGIDHGQLEWRIQPVKGSEITSAPTTDGRRIAVAIRQSFEKKGDHAIVVIGEDHRNQGSATGKDTRRPNRDERGARP
jgi:eukaryotic-like serine/threonine-protein kinase